MKTVLPIIASGILLGFAYPPVDLGFLAYVALVPLIWLMDSRPPPRCIFLWAFLSGIIFHLLTLSWLRNLMGAVSWMQAVSWLVMLAAVVALSVFYAMPFWVTAVVRSRWPRYGLFILPFAIAGVEWARSFDVMAFPWMIVGNSQTGYPWLIQFADITSAFGVSWWVAMVNVAVFLLIRKPTVRRAACLGALFLIPFAYSALVITHPAESGKPLTVALIQGNVFPDEKWEQGSEIENIELYHKMSLTTLESRPDLIIWPETATPVYLFEDYRYRRMVQSLVDSMRVPVLTGTPSIDLESDRKWNAACLVEPDREMTQKYEKIHVVPFGEAFPFDNIFPALRNIELGQANWDEGTERTVFKPYSQVPPFNVAICFESIFPDLIRQFIVNGSRFIVVITNDVWFGKRSAPIQHARIAALRAIEFHRPVARCANTGISMFIDPYGRITSRTRVYEPATLIGTIQPDSRLTFYARYGNIFSIFCCAVSIIAGAAAFVTARTPLQRAS